MSVPFGTAPPFNVAGLDGLRQTTITLDSSAINNLHSSPQTLVPAPGANNIIIPLSFTASLDYSATFTDGGKKITARMGSANPLWQTSIIDTEQTADRFASGFIGWVGNFGATSSYTNQSIDLWAESPYTGGAGSKITFTCVFYVIDASYFP